VKPMPRVTAMPPTDAPPPVRPEPRPIKPPVTACNAEGTPLFEIRKRSEVEQPTSTTAIYSTGAWTFQPIDKDGHLGALMTGCFDKPTLQSIRNAVNDAPWDVTYSRFVCRAYSASFTQYYVHGKLEYTARLCNGQRLDDESAAAIKVIEADLANVLPKQDPVVVRDHRAAPMPASPVVVRDHRAAL